METAEEIFVKVPINEAVQIQAYLETRPINEAINAFLALAHHIDVAKEANVEKTPNKVIVEEKK